MPTIDVLDSTMSYVDVGEGTPIVLLHGNPTSKYLWRNVIPAIGAPGRIIAPDLIGMGESGKPPIDYRFAQHADYVDAFLDALGVEQAIVVGHDWGGIIGLDWAARHPERTRGVAFLETALWPMTWDEFPPVGQDLFKRFRTPGVGEAMILDHNALIENGVPVSINRRLSDEEMDAYRKPFPTPESRRPLLSFPRQIPIEGEPADVVERVGAYSEWLKSSPEVPKLFLWFEGAPWSSETFVGWCRDNVPGIDIVAGGPAGHHAPEDQPEAIGVAIAEWADRHGLRAA
jgi:haloalkane dehalogenase